MSSRQQLDVRNLSLGMRLVNAYEVEAGRGCRGKLVEETNYCFLLQNKRTIRKARIHMNSYHNCLKEPHVVHLTINTDLHKKIIY